MAKTEEVNIFIEIIKNPILSAIIAAITATFVSPYIKWGVEKKKIRHSNRKELLVGSRECFSELKIDTLKRFSETYYIHQLLPHFSKDIKTQLNALNNEYDTLKAKYNYANPSSISFGNNISDDMKESYLNLLQVKGSEVESEIHSFRKQSFLFRDKIYAVLNELEQKWKLI